ncbi:MULTISPECIES: iron donor protein CyaY [Testudinibacter]|uniref:Iron-sulfur cluster assembly protein CyaY n=1 Tax=Testudinibacter aquarius TaxID=1524974 RepID=A0A4R3XZ63_9PAST|nr:MULTISPECIES: iron donor protein CyaY [Testudinibacter]TNG93504.1 iron donor protein CyaY [Pasteurellaceae bacterium UScroc12]TNG95938.1 iron donor protein CyaY [Pasteurellaceae bacterium USgator41]TNG97202.1 iron donor protein CyaY [Pasteurellaceae bacterium UScroc31]TNH03002.1 iron donor protein CyaY [Pasteurellaceae bacterium USgator11]TNH06876.1 iron donor protein CyaY [Pasteurellaceae bacterium Phil11]
MNVAEFHQQVEQTWSYIEEQLDEQEVDVDCDTHGSVFSITFENGQQIVINKQEPLLELWLASKLGGYHFKFHDGQWLTADQQAFFPLLSEALSAYYGETVTVA